MTTLISWLAIVGIALFFLALLAIGINMIIIKDDLYYKNKKYIKC